MNDDLQAKVAEIRERHAGNREAAAHDRNAELFRVVGLVTWYDDIDTLFAALDAERAELAELRDAWNWSLYASDAAVLTNDPDDILAAYRKTKEPAK